MSEVRGARLVLLVEDEALLRETVAEALGDLGYAVVEAGDAAAALALLAQGARPDLLVTDVGLPNGDGRLLAESARVVLPGLPVLFITGHGGEAFETALAPGTDVLAKPFRLEALARRVARLVAWGGGPEG